MLDMGFEDEINAILGFVRDRGTLLFSATFPEGVKAIRKKLGTDMVRFDVYSSVPQEIEQLWCAVDESDRHLALVNVIANFGGSLNLENTKIDCAEVAKNQVIIFRLLLFTVIWNRRSATRLLSGSSTAVLMCWSQQMLRPEVWILKT